MTLYTDHHILIAREAASLGQLLYIADNGAKENQHKKMDPNHRVPTAFIFSKGGHVLSLTGHC
ncbi:hypothetical protein [Paenibacillus sp. P32E]|uniref:hypothetical protein n=1 Tax=Paenibacillus sp. P32E TaxID=1349434 RepID=UPI000939CE18|nr:hypothetical protein [Paenibacillus sp. P32E]OKP92905.1 hypothetical protein A3848_05865 [Paenibacillus sp. P32E]